MNRRQPELWQRPRKKKISPVTIKRVRFEADTLIEILACFGWTEAKELYAEPNSTVGRRVRLFLHQLKAAGYVDLRYKRKGSGRGSEHLEFRVRR